MKSKEHVIVYKQSLFGVFGGVVLCFSDKWRPLKTNSLCQRWFFLSQIVDKEHCNTIPINTGKVINPSSSALSFTIVLYLMFCTKIVEISDPSKSVLVRGVDGLVKKIALTIR